MTQEVNGKICNLGNVCDCVTVKDLDPCIIIIFGASGDLTTRKLIPALFRMWINNSLPDPVAIVGCARTEFSRSEFIAKIKKECMTCATVAESQWNDFAALLHYFQVEYDSLNSYLQLKMFLKDLGAAKGTHGNKLFDLAVPPHLYSIIADNIGQAGLAHQYKENNGWCRLVVEKPFGSDLYTSQELDKSLHRHFTEPQIFRIDHYLAKETVQNILMLRFANAIFEPLWNRSYIDYVGILAAEQIGIENRSGYYENSGVIRDMFQNHMLQLLSLIAMEPPSHFEAERVRDEKLKLFRSIRPFTEKQGDVVLGQYGPGIIGSEAIPGYLGEKGVAPDSLTPTFALLRFAIENWRWQGVPFYLVSGKRMKRKETRIVIQFKEVPHSLFRDVLKESVSANRLVLSIYPEEGITLSFQTKSPGASVCLRTMDMDFSYQESYKGVSLEAYEKVLLDCILGDHMLFWRQDGVEEAWSLLTPLLHSCERCENRAQKLHTYDAGSWGPDAAAGIIEKIIS
ncbi:MAG: glucose-6-phosphate dehydrogenase [Desulfobulbaceae bacterium]|uniref:Glucose-6-phosphate 1-dehydrogenase n=1 Tax=Candidatus Desulfobia pelagia TaxID=2841692 RepID=A0A8J6TCU1_9BACT|nr:glucose-6-phosphate dehydrogenase [Candidatus Desulfobia pelagia]